MMSKGYSARPPLPLFDGVPEQTAVPAPLDTEQSLHCGAGTLPAPPLDRVREVRTVYEGSDGEKTKELYARLESLGPIGFIAVNLFRAQKASERAKKYRGGVRGRGSYRGMAYDRKQWSLDNLCAALGEHAASIGITYGWGEDAKQEYHRWVLYVELPTGQASFHAATRGAGPDHPSGWDNVPGRSADRIVSWCAILLTEEQK